MFHVRLVASTMAVMTIELQNALVNLRQTLGTLQDFITGQSDLSWKANTSWTAKDVLGHIVFWHESFARNIADVAEHQPERVLRGKLSEVNQRSVEETAFASVDALLIRLTRAQQQIERYIGQEDLGLIPYKKGSRPYAPLEYLTVVNAHIRKHLKGLIQARRMQDI